MLVFLVAIAACDRSEPHPADLPVAGMVTVVRNDAGGAWSRGDGWVLHERWRIGGAGADGPGAFPDQPLGLAVAPDGSVLVLDRGATRVSVFGRDGRFLHAFGRDGQGPGELRGPLGIGFDAAGRLWVLNNANLRYTLFEPAGRLLVEHPRGPLGPHRSSRPLRFDAAGALLDEATTPDRTGIVFVRVDPAGAVLDTLPPIPLPDFGSPGSGPARAAAPGPDSLAGFRPRFLFDVTPTHVWYADSRRLRLYRRTHGGDATLVVETRHRPEPRLTADDERLIDRELTRRGQQRGDYPYSRQAARALHALDDGHILVHIEPGDAHGADRTTLDIFDPDGRFLGTAELGFRVDPLSPIASRGDTLFVVGLDPADARFVARIEVGHGR